ncbi:hypothetical protein [Candidatus Spongiihabitans sp.]
MSGFQTGGFAAEIRSSATPNGLITGLPGPYYYWPGNDELGGQW